MIQYGILLAAALTGLLLAFYIHRKKRGQKKIVCPLHFDCNAVIYSKHSKFLGIPVEMIGIFYYAIIAVSYSFFAVFPALVPPIFSFAVLVMTIGALLFSCYLTFIQVFALKQWCTWCFLSALLCVVIFTAALSISGFGLVALLEQYHGIIVIVHIIAAALGLGAVTITDVLFSKFLKDFRVSQWEAEAMHTMSQFIWFVLIIIITTGIGLYLPEAAWLNHSPKFLVKMIIVAVIVVNGALLNLLIAPNLERIFSGSNSPPAPHYVSRTRKLAFALGAISIVSWYFAFILGLLRKPPISFSMLLLLYAAILAVAVTTSQLAEKFFSKRNGS